MLFERIRVSKEKKQRYLTYIPRLHIPQQYSLLSGLHETGTWDIYLYFDSWPGTQAWCFSKPTKVTASVIKRLMAQFRVACQLWLSRLYGFDGFRKTPIKVRLFGLAFHPDVIVDESVFKTFAGYPIVTQWIETVGEQSPWVTTRRAASFYNATDLHAHKVIANRTEGNYVPKTWDEQYVHPEGCTGFQTRFWHGTGNHAHAQRHYLRMGGRSDSKGYMDRRVLLHEMGHCFGLDDLYDTTKYPGFNMTQKDSVMHTATSLTPFDHAMMRHMWMKRLKHS